ncbi:MAG: NADH oxidase [Actinobacteria bacterium]|nr:NADH oxidase [Actinomycetota bacterium]
MSEGGNLVVVGGLAAGLSAASQVRRRDPRAVIDVFERSSHIAYGACGLPYFVGGRISNSDELSVYSRDVFEQQRNINIHTQHDVERVDVANKHVLVHDVVRDKKNLVEYDTLLLATGAEALHLPVPGVELDGVHLLRTMDDGIALRGQVERNLRARQGARGRAIVVGGGYIGLEVAEALKEAGVEVALVESRPEVLSSVDSDLAGLVHDELERNGISLHLGESVEEIVGVGQVEGVRTSTGWLEADTVVVGVGVRPNTTLGIEAGTELGAGGAIRVDDHMRTSVPDVFAAGDCADTVHLCTGGRVYIPLGTTANKQGRVAGENIGGGARAFRGVLGTAIVKVFKRGVARTGLCTEEARAVGWSPQVTTIRDRSRAHYYPGSAPVAVRLVTGPRGELLGGQLVGPQDFLIRVNALAAAIQAELTVGELREMDFA